MVDCSIKRNREFVRNVSRSLIARLRVIEIVFLIQIHAMVDCSITRNRDFVPHIISRDCRLLDYA